MAKLFEYTAIYNPKPTRDAMGNDTTPKGEIILPISTAVAEADKDVRVIAARAIPEAWESRLAEVEILVSPFV